MDEKKVSELFKDQGFVTGILQMQTKEEVLKAFSDKGVDLTGEELESIRGVISAAAAKNGKISESELDGVAGGVKLSKGAKIAIGTTVGVALAAGGVAGGFLWGRKSKNKPGSIPTTPGTSGNISSASSGVFLCSVHEVEEEEEEEIGDFSSDSK